MTNDGETTIEPITCQGLFYWTGSEYRRAKIISYKKFTRDRCLFYALNIPNVAELTNKEIADSLIIDQIIDQGLESPYIITDPQKTSGGFMMPATEEESTNNPGMRVWIGAIDIPRFARFSAPTSILKDGKVIPLEDVELHNYTIKAAFRNLQTEVGTRNFDAKHGGVIVTYPLNIVDDTNGPEYQPPRPGPARQD